MFESCAMTERSGYWGAKVRVFATTVANIFSSSLRFITNIFIARALGPSAYGELNFLLASVPGIRAFMELGTTQAFFTFISRNDKPAGIYYWYFKWLFFQLVIMTMLVVLLETTGYMDTFWLGISTPLVFMAIYASFLKDTLWSTFNNIAEAKRETIAIQTRNAIIALAHFMLVIIFYFTGMLSVGKILFLIQIEVVAAVLFSLRLVKSEDGKGYERKSSLRNVVAKIKPYCAPLILYSLVGGVSAFGERWILQKYGGSIQQGLYSMSFYLGSLAMLVPASMQKVLWKEIAEATSSGRHDSAYNYYKTGSHLCFISASILAGLSIPWSEQIVSMLAGANYREGASIFSCMVLFSVYQSFGQITGTTLYAVSHTRLLSGIGITGMVAGLIVTYFMIAPADAIVPGLGFGGMGLAIKMLVLTVVVTSVQNVLVCRAQKWPVDWQYQPRTIAVLLASGYISRYLADGLGNGVSVHIKMSLAILIYLCIAALVLLKRPSILGIESQEIDTYFRLLAFWKGKHAKI